MRRNPWVFGALDSHQRLRYSSRHSRFRFVQHCSRESFPLKARRVGGSTHQVPVEIGSAQGKELAIRWLLGASRKRAGRNMAFKLSYELVDAAKGSGDAIRNKEETHRMAEANRVFAHFR